MKINKVLFTDVLLLIVFGIIMIYSSSYIWAEYKFNNPYHYVIYQGIFSIISVIIMIILSKINISSTWLLTFKAVLNKFIITL